MRTCTVRGCSRSLCDTPTRTQDIQRAITTILTSSLSTRLIYNEKYTTTWSSACHIVDDFAAHRVPPHSRSGCPVSLLATHHQCPYHGHRRLQKVGIRQDLRGARLHHPGYVVHRSGHVVHVNGHVSAVVAEVVVERLGAVYTVLHVKQ